MTEEQVLSKLTALCARGEHCLHDMRQKMMRWQIDEELQNKVIAFLLNERFIDEERYCRAFINDKVRYNHWGRKKVAQALYMKHIPSEVFEDMLDDVPDEEYMETLMPVLQSKYRSLQNKELSDYELRGKLLRFAMQRGFTYDQCVECIDQVIS